MEIQYFEPSIEFNKAIYNAPLDLLLLPSGIDKKKRKEDYRAF